MRKVSTRQSQLWIARLPNPLAKKGTAVPMSVCVTNFFVDRQELPHKVCILTVLVIRWYQTLDLLAGQ
jgi:hypothetical protein